MANRYWVGGSGTWNTTSTTNWSTTSGGSSGASVPTSADTVIFDQAGPYTVTMTGALNCLDFIVSEESVTFQDGTSPTLSIAGSLSFVGGTIYNTTGTLTFTSTTTCNINSGEAIFNCPITFNGTGGTFILGDDFETTNTRTLTLTAGTLSLGGYTFTTGFFSSTGSTTRGINFGTGKIALTSNTTATIWNNVITGFTVSGTPLVECSGDGSSVTKTITTGAATESNSISFSLLETSGSVTYTFTAGNSVRNLTLNGSQTLTNSNLTIYGNYTYSTTNGSTTISGTSGTWTFAATSGTKTITAGSVTYDFPWTFNGAGGTWQLASNLTLGSTRTLTLTAGTLALSTYTLTTGLFSSTNSNTRAINFGTGKIVLNNGATNTIWNTGTITGLTVSGTPLVECIGGGTATKTINTGTLTETNSISFSILETTGTLTYSFTTANTVKNLTIVGPNSGHSLVISLVSMTIYGNYSYTAGAGTTSFGSGTNSWTFASTDASTRTITSGSVTYDFPWTFNGLGGTWQLQSNITLGSTRDITLTSGTIDLNNYTFTGGRFVSSNSNARGVAFGTSGQINLGGSNATIVDITTATNFTTTGTPYVVNNSGATTGTRTFSLGFSRTQVAGWDFSISGSSGIVVGTGATDTMSVTGSFDNIDLQGLTNTFANATRTIYGKLTLFTNGGTIQPGASVTTFGATSGTQILTFNGETWGSPVTFGTAEASTATWFLYDDLNLLARALTLVNGNLDFNNKTLTASSTITFNGGSFNLSNFTGASYLFSHTAGTFALGSNCTFNAYTHTAGTINLDTYTLTVYTFTSSNSNTRTINFGTGKIVCNGNPGTGAITAWTTNTITGLTVSGSKLVEVTGGGGTGVTKNIGSGLLTEGNALNFVLKDTNNTNIVVSAASNINNIEFAAGTGGQTFTLTQGLSVFGNFTHTTTNGTTTFGPTGSVVTFASTNGTARTLTGAGAEINFPITFNGTGGTWQLQDNFTVAATRTTLLTAGTLQLQSYTFTSGRFQSSNANVRTIDFGTGKIVVNVVASATAETAWSTDNFDNLTILGEPLVECTGGGTGTKNISAGYATEKYAISYSLLETTGAVTYTFNGTFGNHIKNLTLNGTQTLTNAPLCIWGNYTNDTFYTTTQSGGANAWTFAYSGQQGIASSGNNYSVYFPSVPAFTGSAHGAYMTVPASTDFQFTGDFTIEAWMFIPYKGYASPQTLISIDDPATANIFDVRWFTTRWQVTLNGASGTDIGGNFSPDQWNHIALVRSGSNINLYINGVSTGTTLTNSSTLGYNGVLAIGTNPQGTSNLLQFGNISNLRIVNGVAVYTGNFTVPAGPLAATQSAGANISAITGTETILLTCQNDTIIDNSSYNRTITPNLKNPPVPTGFNPFTVTSTPAGKTINQGTNSITYDFPWQFTGTTLSSWLITYQITLGATRVLTLKGGKVDFNSWDLAGYSNVTISEGVVTLANYGGFLTCSMDIVHSSGKVILESYLTVTDNLGYTFTSGDMALGSYELTTTVFSSSNSNLRSIDFGTGKFIINGTGANATVWTTATSTNLTTSGTRTIDFQGGGGTITKTVSTGTLNQANAFNLRMVDTTATVSYTFSTNSTMNNLWVNGSQTITNSAITIYGNYDYLSGPISAGTNAWTFGASSGTQLLDLNGYTHDFPFTINASGATVKLSRDLTLGATRQLTLTNGTFDFNGWAVSAAGITILTGSPTLANTGSADLTVALPITHTSGTLTLPFNFSTTSVSGYTFTAGNLNLGTYTLATPAFTSSGTGVRTVNFGTGKILLNGTTGITIWSTGTLTNWSVSGTPTVEVTGSTGTVTKTITTGSPTEAQSVNFLLREENGSTVTFGATGRTRDLTCAAGATGQIIFNSALNIYGNFENNTSIGTTTFSAGTNAWTFTSTANVQTINTAGTQLDFPLTFNGAGGTRKLIGNLSLTTTKVLTLGAGEFDFNGYAVSNGANVTITGITTISSTGSNLAIIETNCQHNTGSLSLGVDLTVNGANGYNFVSSNLILNSYTLATQRFNTNTATARTLDFGTGKIDLTGSNRTILDYGGTTNLTTLGNVYIISSYTGGTGTRTFSSALTEAQANGYNVSTNGTSGIVIGTTATDSVALTGNYNDIDLTGLTNTLTNTARTLYGNLILPASGGTLTGGTLATTFSGSNVETITTNGRVIDFPLTFNGTGTYRLSDALNTSTRAITLTAGTLDLNDFTYTAGNLISSGTGVRTIDFGDTGQLTLTTNGANVIDFATASNASFTGNQKIFSSYSGATGTRTFVFGNAAGATPTNTLNVKLGSSGTGLLINNGTDSIALVGSFNDLDLTGLGQTVTNTVRTFFGNIIIPSTGGTLTAGASITSFVAPTSNTRTITTNGRTLDFPITIGNGTSNGVSQLSTALTVNTTTALTLASGNLDFNDFTLTSNAFVSNTANYRIMSFKDTGQLTLTGSNTTIWNSNNGANLNASGTERVFSSYTGATGTRTVDFGNIQPASAFNVRWNAAAQSNAFTFAGGTDSIALTGALNDIDFTGSTGTITNTARTIYGNFTTPAGATNPTFTAGNVETTFATTGTQTITTNGRTIDFVMGFGNGTSNGTARLGGALTLGTSRNSNLFSGTLDLNNFTLTSRAMIANGTNSRTLAFGSSGQVTLTLGSSTILEMRVATNFTYTGTPKILLNWVSNVNTRQVLLGNTAGFTVGGVINKDNMFDVSMGGTTGLIFASGSDSLAIQGQVRDLNLSNLTGTTANWTNQTLSVYGNFTLPSSGGTIATGANTVTFAGYSDNYTIASGARTLNFPITFNGNGNFTINNTFTVGNGTSSTTTLTLTTGNITINNVQINCGQFNSNSGNVRSLTFNPGGTSRIVMYNSNTTIWNSNNGSNFSWSGNIDIESSRTAGNNVGTRVFDFGNISEQYAMNVKIATAGDGFSLNTANDIVSIIGSVGDLDLTSIPFTLNNSARTVYGNLTIPATGGTLTTGTAVTTFASTSGTKTINTNGRTIQFPLRFDGVGGNWTLSSNIVANTTTVLTLANGTVDFAQRDANTWANITIAGGASGNAALSNLVSNRAMVHTSGNLTILSGAVNSSTTGTYALSGGTLNVSANFSTGAFTQTGGNIIL